MVVSTNVGGRPRGRWRVCWPAVLNEQMEGVWSSDVALRGETSNHPEVR